MKIGYLTFGRDDFGYGLSLCLSQIQARDLYRVTPKTARYVDVLLFSCFWWEHIYLLADFLRRAGIRKSDKDRPRIIVGGFNTFNPVPFQAYADAVVCGDGEDVLPSVLGGGAPGFVWQNAQNLTGFCHETNNIARIELARGCKYRCRFCAVAHLKPYREAPVEQIEAAIKSTKLRRVSLFAPEPTLHSADVEITSICHRLGKTRVDSDVRLDRLSKRSDSVPRVGIVGLSERLRKSINKPYSNKRIIGAVKEAIEQGRKGLFMYMILDLPGEQKEDWQEFGELLEEIGSLPGAERFLLKPSPSVFMPNPHTPMEYERINWDCDYRAAWQDFFGIGESREWRVLMAERSRVFGSGMRVLSMVSTRAGEEFAEIEQELSRVKAVRLSNGRVQCGSVKKMLSVLKKYGGVEKYCGPYTAEEAPWKALIFESCPTKAADRSAGHPGGAF